MTDPSGLSPVLGGDNHEAELAQHPITQARNEVERLKSLVTLAEMAYQQAKDECTHHYADGETAVVIEPGFDLDLYYCNICKIVNP